MKTRPAVCATRYVIWGLLPIFWKLLAQVDSVCAGQPHRVVHGAHRRHPAAAAGPAGRCAGRVPGPEGVGAAGRCGLRGLRQLGRLHLGGGQRAHDRLSLAYYMNPILAILLGTVLFRSG